MAGLAARLPKSLRTSFAAAMRATPVCSGKYRDRRLAPATAAGDRHEAGRAALLLAACYAAFLRALRESWGLRAGWTVKVLRPSALAA